MTLWILTLPNSVTPQSRTTTQARCRYTTEPISDRSYIGLGSDPFCEFFSSVCIVFVPLLLLHCDYLKPCTSLLWCRPGIQLCHTTPNPTPLTPPGSLSTSYDDSSFYAGSFYYTLAALYSVPRLLSIQNLARIHLLWYTIGIYVSSLRVLIPKNYVSHPTAQNEPRTVLFTESSLSRALAPQPASACPQSLSIALKDNATSY